jgi:hypothetical protein
VRLFAGTIHFLYPEYMPDKKMPGSYVDAAVREWFARTVDAYLDVWGHTPRLVDAGMEDIRSPYMALIINGQGYLLIERRNDDGEWAPLMYDAHDLAISTTQRIFALMSKIDEYDEELTYELRERGIDVGANDGRFEDSLTALLYGYRDLVSPNALD